MIELNRAVAVAMQDGPSAGLDLIDGILARGDLEPITWPTRLVLISAADWGEQRKLAPPMNGL